MDLLRYLERHADPRVHTAELPDGAWTEVLVVPAHREADHLPALLRSFEPSSDPPLMVVLVNGKVGQPEHTSKNNERTLRELLQLGPRRSLGGFGPRTAQVQTDRLALWVVDLTPTPLGPKQGVGHVRKLGADLVVRLREQGKAPGHFWSTDADARWPGAVPVFPPGACAAVVPFVHEPLTDAMALYELRLRTWVLGTQRAGSPYAFHTLGSVTGVDVGAYVSVYGFPKRLAGEDFHLLNKLAKLGEIHSLRGDPIRLSSRPSDRVPFGTGPGVRDAKSFGTEYRLRNHGAFVELARWRDALDEAAAEDWAQLSERCAEFSIKEGIFRRSVQGVRSRKKRLDQLQRVFDGLRWVQVANGCRRGDAPDVNWRESELAYLLGDGTAWDGSAQEAVAALIELEEKVLWGTRAGVLG